MEATIKAIKTKPGTGDYDVVLVPPFPAIEIVRGRFKGGDGRPHWLSLDNRRLYCLQRAAAALWPQRAAVSVEAMRAPTEGVRRKLNSSVNGLSVSIGHSPKMLTGRWDWRLTVADVLAGAAQGSEYEAAHKLVVMDDAKANIQDLPNAETAPSMVDLFFQYVDEKAGAPSDSSTAEPRSPRGSETSNDSGLEPALLQSVSKVFDQHEAEDWMPDISGAWKDDNGNTYNVTLVTDLAWTCWRKNQNGSRRKFTLWYDGASDSVSWGDDWSFWADASEVRRDGNSVRWFGAKDAGKRKPRFQWCQNA